MANYYENGNTPYNDDFAQEILIDSLSNTFQNNDLDKAKALIKNVNFSSDYNVDNKNAELLFIKACMSGNLDIVKLLIESQEITEYFNLPQYINTSFQTLVKNYDDRYLDIVSYLMNDTNVYRSDEFDSNLPSLVLSSVLDDNLPLFKVLLNLDNSEKNNIFALSNQTFQFACANHESNIAKFFYIEPKLRKTIEPELGFKHACLLQNTELLKFLVFEYKIEKTESIEAYLEGHDFVEIKQMFNIRELNKELNSELNNNEVNTKKLKL